MKLKTISGAEVEILQELDIHGQKYFLVNPGFNKYVGGILTKFLVVPTSQFDKSAVLSDRVEIVE